VSTHRRNLGPVVEVAFLIVCALAIAFLIFVLLMMGECLPRNGSAAMHACDAGKHFEFFAFPLTTLASVVAGATALRSGRRIGLAIIGLAPFLALTVVLLVERGAF